MRFAGSKNNNLLFHLAFTLRLRRQANGNEAVQEIRRRTVQRNRRRCRLDGELELHIAAQIANNGNGGHSGGLGAQDARPQTDTLIPAAAGKFNLFPAETAFRPEQEVNAIKIGTG